MADMRLQILTWTILLLKKLMLLIKVEKKIGSRYDTKEVLTDY